MVDRGLVKSSRVESSQVSKIWAGITHMDRVMLLLGWSSRWIYFIEQSANNKVGSIRLTMLGRKGFDENMTATAKTGI